MTFILCLLLGCLNVENKEGINYFVDSPETMLLMRFQKSGDVGFFVRKETNPPDSILHFSINFANGSYLEIPSQGYTTIGDSAAVFGVKCNSDIIIMILTSRVISVTFKVNDFRPPDRYYIDEGLANEFRHCVFEGLQNKKVKKWLKL